MVSTLAIAIVYGFQEHHCPMGCLLTNLPLLFSSTGETHSFVGVFIVPREILRHGMGPSFEVLTLIEKKLSNTEFSEFKGRYVPNDPDREKR